MEKKSEKENQTPKFYDNLAVAVVEQAVADYRLSLKRIRQHREICSDRKMVVDCEQFFLHDIEIWCDVDGKAIMEEIQKFVDTDVNRKWTRRH